MGFATTMSTLLRNRALTGMVAGSLSMLIAMMLVGGMLPDIHNEYFNNGQLLSAVSFVGLAPTLLRVPFAAKLAKLVGKKEVGVFGLCLGIAAALVLSSPAPTARTCSWPVTRCSYSASPA